MLNFNNDTDWVKKLKIKMTDPPNSKPEIRCFPNDIESWFQVTVIHSGFSFLYFTFCILMSAHKITPPPTPTPTYDK